MRQTREEFEAQSREISMRLKKNKKEEKIPVSGPMNLPLNPRVVGRVDENGNQERF